MEKKIEQQMRQGYQTARIAYANWPRAVFGFLEATADEVRAADATALAGFPRIEVDPWLWGMTGAPTGLKSA
jgi:hypothetical protein